MNEMYGTTNLRGYTAGECYPLPVDEYTKKACHCLCLKEVEFELTDTLCLTASCRVGPCWCQVLIPVNSLTVSFMLSLGDNHWVHTGNSRRDHGHHFPGSRNQRARLHGQPDRGQARWVTAGVASCSGAVS